MDLVAWLAQVVQRWLTASPLTLFLVASAARASCLLFSTKNVPWADVDHATWANFGKYCHLRLFLKGDEGDEESSRPPIRLDGFQRELYGQVSGEWVSGLCFDLLGNVC
jgi:hypothetical protein